MGDDQIERGYEEMVGRLEKLQPCLVPTKRDRALGEAAELMRHRAASWRAYHKCIAEPVRVH